MVYAFDLSKASNEDLIAHDRMMAECVIAFKNVSSISMSVWSVTLKEMEKRDLIAVASGSLDDVGNAHVLRKYEVNQ